MNDFITLKGISKRYGGVTALRDINLTLRKGEVHCLVGENGSGKSTMIKIIAGVERPESNGEIHIDGAVRKPAEVLSSGKIHVIYQDLAVFPNLSAAENIAFHHNLGPMHFVRRAEQRRIAQKAIDRIKVHISLDKLASDCSVGERQLIAICRALTGEAELVIMDEPTASLTATEVSVLLDVVRGMKAAGICVVFVSHRLNEVLAVADRVTVIRDGNLIGTYPATEMDGRRIAELMTGRSFETKIKRRLSAGGKARLKVSDLAREKEYRDVSFELLPGEIVGLVGLLGAGRTELAMTLFGVTRPDRGSFEIDGAPVQFRSNRDAIAAGIGYLSEDRLTLGLMLDQSIAANATITVIEKLSGLLGINRGARQRLVADLIARLGIKTPDTRNAVNTLSGGNQQRVVLAKWIAAGPRLLILDNPTAGVDIRAKAAIYEIVDRLAADGLSILLISDEVEEVYHHSNRVLVMRRGALVGEFCPSEVDEIEIARAIA